MLLLLFWLIGVSLGVEVHQSPAEVLRKLGEKVQLVCSHNKTDYTLMQWYQKPAGEQALKRIGHVYYGTIEHEKPFESNFNITGDMSGETAKNGSLFIADLKADHSAVYYCAASYEAYFGQGTKLTVLETDLEVTPPTNVKILPPSPNECRNQKDKKRKKTLVCVASGFYPDHVEVLWKSNGKEAKDGVATDSAAKRVDKFYRITSRLRVPAEDYNTASNTFTCIVSFFDGEKKILREASINGTQGKTEGGMTREKYLRLTQSAKLSYTVVIVKSCFYGVFVGVLVWKLQGSARKHH